MSKKVYPNINGIAYTGKKMMCNINGVAHKAIKGYCNINGVAYVFWDSGATPVSEGFWFYFSTLVEKIIQGKRYTVVPTQVQVDINKINNGIAFYLFFQLTSGGSIYDNWTVVLSTQNQTSYYDAVCQGSTEHYDSYYTDTVTINGDTWYYTIGTPIVYDYAPQYPADISPDCILHDPVLAEEYSEYVIHDFLDKYIYTDEFTEDYQVGSDYNLNITDIALTLKKAIAIYLFKNVEYQNDGARSRACYLALLQNVPDIIAHFLAFVYEHDCNCVWIRLIPTSLQLIEIECAKKSTVPVSVTQKNTVGGYTNYTNLATDAYITIYKYQASFDYGTITYSDRGTRSDKFQNTMGVKLQNYGDFYQVSLSNTGITFNGVGSLIPVMTSNSAPYGTVTSNYIVGYTNGSYLSANEAYYAFDNNPSTCVEESTDGANGEIEYTFDSPVSIQLIKVTACKLTMYTPRNEYFNVSVYYGGAWHTYGTFYISDDHGLNYEWKDYTISGALTGVSAIKIQCTTPKDYGYNIAIQSIEVY